MNNQFLNNLKRQAEENPALAIVVGAMSVTAVSKLLNAMAQNKNSHAWAKEVSRRAMKDSRKNK